MKSSRRSRRHPEPDAAAEKTPDRLDPARRPYRPWGAAEKLCYARDREILLAGPAGTGKTRAALEKIFLCLQKYPAMRALLVRKTRASLTQSVLVTLEEKVFPRGHPALGGPGRGYRHGYRLENGAELVLGGLDNPDRIMSSEYDMVLACEATELTIEDWEKLLTRLRNAVLPYQQAIAECNPAHPGHWLNARADAGLMLRLVSRHQDNPTLFDRSTGRWTGAGENYLHTLRRLSGVRRKRLLDGLWAAPQGLVYEMLPDHVISIPPPEGRTLRCCAGIDWGWRDPTAVVVGLLCRDSCLYVVDELYESRLPLEELARRLDALVRRWDIEIFFADRSRPELIDHLRRRDIACRPVPAHGIESGIAMVESRLLAGGLKISARCRRLIDEASQYQYAADAPTTGNSLPIPLNDHAMDALRYLVAAMDMGRSDPAAFEPVSSVASLPSSAPKSAAGDLPNAAMENTRSHERLNFNQIWGE